MYTFVGKTMSTHIKIQFSDFSVSAELLETPTANQFKQTLPFSSQVNRWGEEIYFGTAVSMEQEPEAREVVEKGEIGYWPPGKAMAIFFGPTPVSVGDECRAASPVNVFARISGDLSALSGVPSGSPVSVELEEGGSA